MKKYSRFLLLSVSAIFYSLTLSFAQQNYSAFVNPMIGTGGHGHTFPGSTVPFGMVQLSPDTRIDGSWDGCSGYHYSDSLIYGFSHTHLSGTGCSDYGDIALMPMMGAPSFDAKKYASKFSHKNERAAAGCYFVKLEDDDIDVELTSTTRVGFHKYTFNKAGKANFIIDLNHRDKLIDGEVEIINDSTLEIYRRSEAWAKDQYIYARIVFSKGFKVNLSKAEYDNVPFSQKNSGGPIYKGNNLKVSVSADVKKGEVVYVKVSISNVNIDGARKNLKTELSHWNFNKVKKEAVALWNKELSKIEVTSSDKERKSIFYTALYHTMIQPNIAMDVDGIYRGRDNKIHKAEGFTYYSVFSLWDTFRSAHPLYTIIDRKRTQDFVYTFLEQYKQGGRLPVWELASNETDCMIGYHSVSVIADAAAKGILNYDPKLKYSMNLAFEAMKHSATLDHLGLKAYKQNGFISMDDEHESVSKTLEYAYDDWCIAQIAEHTSNYGDYTNFMRRSQSWKNVFDPRTGFMRPKKNSGWLSPFEPREVNNNFTEANAWQYTFFVPHDVYGLVEQMGGAHKFDAKLDELFSTSSQTTGREQVDITGLVGQYAHGNEPSHHIAYLYNYIGKPWKTQEHIYQLLNDFYKNTPDGLIGNEDCGQMSAWYVLSSMGFYQVCPGDAQFQIGTPLFSNVKINLENGKVFEIKSNNLSDQNRYIKSAKMNKVPVKENKFSYADIYYPENNKSNSMLVFEMSSNPNTIPDSNLFIADPLYFHNYNNGVSDKEITIVPIVKSDSKVFEDSLKIELITNEKNTKIYYTLESNGLMSSENLDNNQYSKTKEYLKPFYIVKTDTLAAYAVKEISPSRKMLSNAVVSHYYKRPNNWDINIVSKYNPQYTAGGDKGIIDGVKGEVNWRKGEWQGYQSQDFECIIDLKKEQAITTFSTSFLQDTRAWILMPTKVDYYTSSDNINFKLAGTVENAINANDFDIRIQNLTAKTDEIKTRYVKIKAYNFGVLPSWHQGAGGDAFIFIDEIAIK